MLTNKQKGNLTELQVITKLYELEYSASIPYGENSRYDLIADINGILIKIQVKTSCKYNKDANVYIFSCRSTQLNSKKIIYHTYTKEQIDYFATVIQDKCYLIPVEECGQTKYLRLDNTRNGRMRNINIASDYEIEKQLLYLLNKQY